MRKNSTHHISTRLKMSESHTGLKHTDETKDKISKSRRVQEEQKKREQLELEYLRKQHSID